MTKTTTKISITIEKCFLEKFDNWRKRKSYVWRAPAIREAMQKLMEENYWTRKPQ